MRSNRYNRQCTGCSEESANSLSNKWYVSQHGFKSRRLHTYPSRLPVTSTSLGSTPSDILILFPVTSSRSSGSTSSNHTSPVSELKGHKYTIIIMGRMMVKIHFYRQMVFLHAMLLDCTNAIFFISSRFSTSFYSLTNDMCISHHFAPIIEHL